MTTRALIVNFGPDVLKVRAGDNPAKILYPHQYVEEYVYDNHDVVIVEDKEATPSQFRT